VVELIFRFFTEQPQTVLFKIFDQDNLGKNDPMGEASFDTKPLFQKPGAALPAGEEYEGNLKLIKAKKGAIGVKITCKAMTPVKTEKLLALCEQQLKAAQNEAKRQVKYAEDFKHQLEASKKEIEEIKSAQVGALAECENVKKALAERETKVKFLEGKIVEIENRIGNKTKEVEELQKKLLDKEHEEAPIVIDEKARPFCVCFGANCSIM
jgi:hypothetical protein